MDDNQRDLMIAEIRTDVALIKQRLDILQDHEGRIRGLERFRYAVPGAAMTAVGVSIVSIVLTVVAGA